MPKCEQCGDMYHRKHKLQRYCSQFCRIKKQKGKLNATGRLDIVISELARLQRELETVKRLTYDSIVRGYGWKKKE